MFGRAVATTPPRVPQASVDQQARQAAEAETAQGPDHAGACHRPAHRTAAGPASADHARAGELGGRDVAGLASLLRRPTPSGEVADPAHVAPGAEAGRTSTASSRPRRRRRRSSRSRSSRSTLRPLGDVQIFERQAVGDPAPYTVYDKNMKERTTTEPSFNWTITVLAPQGEALPALRAQLRRADQEPVRPGQGIPPGHRRHAELRRRGAARQRDDRARMRRRPAVAVRFPHRAHHPPRPLAHRRPAPGQRAHVPGQLAAGAAERLADHPAHRRPRRPAHQDAARISRRSRTCAGSGIDWDEGPIYQSARLRSISRRAWRNCSISERAYPCICTRKEVDAAASAPHAEDGAAIYPGTCRDRFASIDDAARASRARARDPLRHARARSRLHGRLRGGRTSLRRRATARRLRHRQGRRHAGVSARGRRRRRRHGRDRRRPRRRPARLHAAADPALPRAGPGRIASRVLPPPAGHRPRRPAARQTPRRHAARDVSRRGRHARSHPGAARVVVRHRERRSTSRTPPT